MRCRIVLVSLCVVLASFVTVSPATAQLVGTFSWQLQPTCNRVTLAVTHTAGLYTLDGFDDQCGAERRAPVSGTAVLNPNGTIGLGLTIVTTPGGEPLHVDAAIDLVTLSGPWGDSAGNDGVFAFNGAADGWLRPTGESMLTSVGELVARITGRRANGTAAAPSAVTNGASLLIIGARGHNGNGFVNGNSAQIAMQATENWKNLAHGARILFSTTPNGGPFANTRMIISHDGKVGIGTTAPAALLDVQGNIRIGSGTNGCVQDRGGTIIAGLCVSDLRLKRDIMSFDSMLDKVAALRPVHFYWRADEFPSRAFGASESYGLIAQEVEQVLPELVTTDDEGYRAVNYSKLPLVALQAIKELKGENDALKRRLATIEARLKLP